MEEVTITSYKVGVCGFYIEEARRFGGVKATFRKFNRWVGGLGSIGESSTYQASEDDDILRAFCIDIRQLDCDDRWLLVTWNELEHVDEGVQVVEVASKIGDANISAVEVDAMNLPGYPAYFYIDAARGVVLNLRFEQRLNGSRQFQRFVLGFLTSCSPWCVWDEDDDERLLGYAPIDGDVVDGAVPKFKTNLGRVAGRLDFVRENRENIRKVIRRANIDPKIEEHKSFLDLSYSILGMGPNNRLKAEIGFQYEFKMRFNEERLERVIARYEEGRDDPWDDVGFVMARDAQKIHWLSGSVARDKVRIDVGRLENGMIDMDDLVEFLNADADGLVERLNGQG